MGVLDIGLMSKCESAISENQFMNVPLLLKHLQDLIAKVTSSC